MHYSVNRGESKVARKAIGYQLSAISLKLSAISYQLSAFSLKPQSIPRYTRIDPTKKVKAKKRSYRLSVFSFKKQIHLPQLPDRPSGRTTNNASPFFFS
jgi:hypothetical protein